MIPDNVNPFTTPAVLAGVRRLDVLEAIQEGLRARGLTVAEAWLCGERETLT